MKDEILISLMNYMRENEAVFFYSMETNCFALVTNHNVPESVLTPKDSIQCSFMPPDGDMGDVGNNFIGPAIHAMERGMG